MFVEPRPFAREFLRAVGEVFTVYIYTAGKKSYADAVLDIIDCEQVIQKRFYR
jgi:TFIIF-interacting CTD phosphatase-like protein